MEVIAHLLAAGAGIPNNPRLPVLAYRGAVRITGADPAAIFERLFSENLWVGCWRNGIFPFHHYHSTAHEVLGVYQGTATVALGGETGITLDIAPGDVVVIPAGVGHKRLAAAGGLGIVGAYPAGQDPDMCRGHRDPARQHADNVARVPLPALDPVCGAGGPLFTHWQS
ncbi:MAG: cupin domain-containing protein [Gammaproteobacteria bacterium]|nr:cupin domain-containing protein [Gammaproteobacteria bacterium]